MNIILLSSDGEISTSIILCVFGFLISAFLTRWIFGIPTIIEHLKWQLKVARVTAIQEKIRTKILAKWAKTQGLSDQEIKNIIEESEMEVKNL